jgi:transcriptional regulator GlxA family with amidase domain
MEGGLQGKKVALVATVDATQAAAVRRALEQEGAVVETIGEGQAAPSPALDYGALVAVGAAGDGAADRARPQFPREVVQLVRELAMVEKPVVALGSAVSLLVDADVVRGRRVSAPSTLRERLEEAGAHLASEPLVRDERMWTGTGAEDATRIAQALCGTVSDREVDQSSEMSFPASDPPPGPASI